MRTVWGADNYDSDVSHRPRGSQVWERSCHLTNRIWKNPTAADLRERSLGRRERKGGQGAILNVTS